MSGKNSFVVQAVASALRPEADIFALGTDARPRCAWSEKGKIFTLSPKGGTADPGAFLEAAARFLRRHKNHSFRLIAFDPHPYFACSRLAGALKKTYFPNARLTPIFHHVAHAALGALTHGLRKEFMALTWDGTGFGADAKVWGGEFLVYRGRAFRRAAHFDYQFLPGNEKAVLEPWRAAFAILHRIYGEKIFKMSLRFLKNKTAASTRLLIEMMQRGLSSPLTSSVGRLFDAAAALLMLPSPMALEGCAGKGRGKAVYSFEIIKEKGGLVINPDLIFEGMVADLEAGVSCCEVALKFHRALAESACVTAILLRQKFGAMPVYCSGGVFMNDVLRQEITRVFASESFQVMFAPKDLTTDAGIALGQIAACALGETLRCV